MIAPTNPTFVTIVNGVDNRFSIIMNVETGYYNITKSATTCARVKAEENGVVGNSPQPRGKITRDWFRNQTTQEQLQECAAMHSITVDDCKFIINERAENDYRGTYIHPMLYDPFMQWLDAKYAMRVSTILKMWHQDANRRVLQEKDDAIAGLSEQVSNLTEQITDQTAQIAQQTRNFEEQKAQIEQLLGYAQSTTNTLDDVKDELTDTKNILIETQEEVTTAKSYLEEKSYHSTKNPSNENLHHCFAATKYVKKNGDEVAKFVTGQRKYVVNTMNKYVEEDNHKIAVPMFYNANGIDLRQNAQEAFKLKRREVVKDYNDRVAADAKAINIELLKEIRAHNKLHPENIRIYELEKLKPKKITVGAITVKFAKLQFTYTQNEYMSFDEVLKVILDTNRSTQSSPMDSSDSEEE